MRCLRLALACCLTACAPDAAPPSLAEIGETHLANVRQLTFGGQNAEAYFSSDGRRLIFQRTDPSGGCDQQFTMEIDGSDLRRVSSGRGRTTCGYYIDGDRRLVYSSTEHVSVDCPAPPDFTRGYVWALHDYDLYTATAAGGEQRVLFRSAGYDAEATVSPDGSTIVFTSLRDGDLDIYTMKPDGSDVRRLTSELGYDGGAFFSPDGTEIIYRSYHPQTPAEEAEYRQLLREKLVKPSRMEIWIMNADGSDRRRVTALGKANFAPFFHPDGQRIVFASNHHDPSPRARQFDLFLVYKDGTGLDRVTTYGGFDGFPVFSPDRAKLVFASNRNGSVEGETNIFIADWIE